MKRCLGTLGVFCLLASGCVNPQTRMQMAEDGEKERDLDVPIVKSVAEVAGAGPVRVQAVGLVTGLNGTGHCPPGYYRTLLEQYLLKNIGKSTGEISNDEPHLKVRKILDSPNNAMVIVEGMIPVGARRGDCYDVDVKLAPGSKATSLAGGYLQLALLRVYEAKSALSQNEKYARDNTLLPSAVLGQAKGPLMVGLGVQGDSHELKSARVWQGGISRIDRPYTFLLKVPAKEQSFQISNRIAQRINFMFQDDPHRPLLNEQQKYHMEVVNTITDQLNQNANMAGLLQTDMAKAIGKGALNVRVPFAYRHDHARYLRVAMLTPVLPQIRDDDPSLVRYRSRLRRMLMDPHDTMVAALRLEAMGRDSIPLLRDGLESPHDLVRFTSAESLAYLGSTFGVETLGQIAQQYPTFAQPVCVALAGLGETVCRDTLAELLNSREPAVRCAAFHALCLDEKNDPSADLRLGGILVNDTFWFHRLPKSATPTVYYSTDKRAQVLLFGRDIFLVPETRMIIGKNFTVVTNPKGDQCVVKRITTQGERQHKCSHRLDEVLVALSELDATYPEIVEFLKKVHDYRKLNCPVTAWTVPEVSLESLVEAGRGMK